GRLRAGRPRERDGSRQARARRAEEGARRREPGTTGTRRDPRGREPVGADRTAPGRVGTIARSMEAAVRGGQADGRLRGAPDRAAGAARSRYGRRGADQGPRLSEDRGAVSPGRAVLKFTHETRASPLKGELRSLGELRAPWRIANPPAGCQPAPQAN